jgi:hypothetical protein
MSTVAITTEQQGRLQVGPLHVLYAKIVEEFLANIQAEVQRELEKREWAEPNGKLTFVLSRRTLLSPPDNVMAEYITVLIGEFKSHGRGRN